MIIDVTVVDGSVVVYKTFCPCTALNNAVLNNFVEFLFLERERSFLIVGAVI